MPANYRSSETKAKGKKSKPCVACARTLINHIFKPINCVGIQTVIVKMFFFSFSHYQVLVHRVKEWTEEISDWSNFGPDFFISAQIPAASVNPSMVFVVGDGKTYDSYINKKLLSGQKYNIYSRALTTMPSKVYSRPHLA